jgi:hypothetical protein
MKEEMSGLKLDSTNLCSACCHVWNAAYEATSDLKDLKVEYQEEHIYPQLEILEQRASLGCTFCSFLRATLRDKAETWFKSTCDEVPSCNIFLHHLEIFLDAEPTASGKSIKYANGSCIAFVERLPELRGALGQMQECRFSVFLNHGK